MKLGIRVRRELAILTKIINICIQLWTEKPQTHNGIMSETRREKHGGVGTKKTKQKLTVMHLRIALVVDHHSVHMMRSITSNGRKEHDQGPQPNRMFQAHFRRVQVALEIANPVDACFKKRKPQPAALYRRNEFVCIMLLFASFRRRRTGSNETMRKMKNFKTLENLIKNRQ